MQVYRELRIITARPTPQEESEAPHRLYGILPANEACSVARWLNLAKEAIEKAWAEGLLPIVTGGTGLYLKALMDGLSPIPDMPQEARIKATILWQERGDAALREYDPAMAAQLKSGDKQRHIRALEVVIATDKSLAVWQALPRQKPYKEAEFDVEYIDMPRNELYRRCDARFLKMMDAGALEEVRTLIPHKLSSELPAMRAVGVPELMGYLKGAWNKEEAIDRGQQATRNYAKRQLTWFRHQLKAV